MPLCYESKADAMVGSRYSERVRTVQSHLIILLLCKEPPDIILIIMRSLNIDRDCDR